MLKRIHQLIKDITRDPYRGMVKPESLKHVLRVIGLVESRASIGSFIAFKARRSGSPSCGTIIVAKKPDSAVPRGKLRS